MSSPVLVDSSLKSIHLLRALLREASYLPDANARIYFRRYIVHRFKTYQPKQHATASEARYRHGTFRRRDLNLIRQRAQPLLRKGHKGLNFLSRANQGELTCLKKVLLLTYGRIGRRRYRLLDKLLQPDPLFMNASQAVVASGNLAPLRALYFSNKRFLQFFDTPKVVDRTHLSITISDQYSRLRTVLKSQCVRGLSVHRAPKQPHMKREINNIWERPVPIKRARNDVRRWYASTMSKLLPPLPTEEWDHLQAMVAGSKQTSVKKRRIPAQHQHPQIEDKATSLRHLVSRAIAMERPSKAVRPTGAQRPQVITRRYMHRIYKLVFALCCKVEYNSDKERWFVTWGNDLNFGRRRIHQTSTDALLFSGVDEKGRLLR